MSVKAADCNVHFLLEKTEHRGLGRKPGGTIPLVDEKNHNGNFDHLFEMLYSIIIFRTLGRTAPFEHYAKEAKQDNRLPKPNQREEFLKYVRRTCDGNTGKTKLGRWISDQHKGSVPKAWHTQLGFNTFVDLLEDTLMRHFKPFFEQHDGVLNQTEDSWLKAVEVVNEVLKELSSESDSSSRWLAQMIVGDMDEIFDQAFGKCRPKDLVPGYGSQTCLVYLQNAGLFNKKEKKNERQNFADALTAIIDYMNDAVAVPDEVLVVLGYKRKDGQVVSLINGRTFDAKDAEHFMCKLYFQVKFTLANYRISSQPEASRTYCWPQKFHDTDLEENKLMWKLMANAVNAFRKLRTSGTDLVKELLSMPSVVVLSNETIPEPPPGWNNWIEEESTRPPPDEAAGEAALESWHFESI